MTPQEAIEKGAQCQAEARRASELHQLAVQAFGIACARFDWKQAEKEHQLAADHLDAYLNALAACHRLAQEIGK